MVRHLVCSHPHQETENAAVLAIVVSSPLQKYAVKQVYLVDVQDICEEHDTTINKVPADRAFLQTYALADIDVRCEPSTLNEVSCC